MNEKINKKSNDSRTEMIEMMERDIYEIGTFEKLYRYVKDGNYNLSWDEDIIEIEDGENITVGTLIKEVVKLNEVFWESKKYIIGLEKVWDYFSSGKNKEISPVAEVENRNEMWSRVVVYAEDIARCYLFNCEYLEMIGIIEITPGEYMSVGAIVKEYEDLLMLSYEQEKYLKYLVTNLSNVGYTIEPVENIDDELKYKTIFHQRVG